jgi:hypothetical protein
MKTRIFIKPNNGFYWFFDSSDELIGPFDSFEEAQVAEEEAWAEEEPFVSFMIRD